MTRQGHLPPKTSIDDLASTAFDTIIDVRSPLEFAEDHLPGAINCPVLENDERREIGIMHKEVSPFAAARRGAVLVARNIARHIETRFGEAPRDWRPLIYCWRGGMRSGAMQTVFRQIGWNARQLDGGYRAYRRSVVAALLELPQRFAFCVIGGATGSGKSSILQAIARAGGQVIDLEAIACHKGSVLGLIPDRAQPSQKMFESQLLAALRRLDPARPVYVEAESRKIGRLHLPAALIETMRASRCVEISASQEARVDFLLRDYAYFLARPELLKSRLAALKHLRGTACIAAWQDLADADRWRELVGELLEKHYDPLYARSQNSNYQGFSGERQTIVTASLSEAAIDAIAAELLAA